MDWRLILALTFLLGGALRFYHASQLYSVYLPRVDQEEGYYETGISLLSGHSLGLIPDFRPSAFRAPVYPVFIALIESAWTHPHPGHIRWAQALISLLNVAMVFALAAELASPWAGVFAAALTALDLNQILGVSSLNVHVFYAFPILALCGALLIWMKRRDAPSGALLGFILGLSLMTRSAHFPFPLMLAGAYLFWWRFPETFGARFKRLSWVGAVTLLTLSPVIARNYAQFDKFILLDSYKGSYILLTSSAGPATTTTVEQALDVAESMEPGFRARNLSEGPLHDALLSFALRNMCAHPAAYAWYCVQRFFLFWGGLWLPCLLALSALLLDRKNQRLQGAALVATAFSGYAVAGGAPEYRVAVVPALFVIAGCGLEALTRRFGTRKSPELSFVRPVFTGAFVLLAAVYAGLVVYMILEVNSFHPGVKESPRTHRDGRANEILRLAAVSTTRQSPALETYLLALGRRTASLAILGDFEQARRDLAHARLGLALMQDAVSRRRVERVIEDEALELKSRTVLTEDDLIRGALASADVVTTARGVVGRLLAAGKTEDALKLTDSLVTATAKSKPAVKAGALLVRTRVFLELRRLVRAEADLQHALTEEANNTEARLLLGGLLLAEKRLPQALETLEGKAWPSPGAEAQRRALKAVVLTRLARDGEAAAALASALQLEPHRACAPIGGVERSTLSPDFFNACIARLPGDASLLVDRAVARYLNKDAPGAEMDLRSALRLKPDFLEATLSLATLLAGAGRNSEALQLMTTALAKADSRKAEPVYLQAASLRARLANDLHP